MNEFLNYQIFNNSGQDYLIAIAIFLGLYIILNLVQKIIIAKLKKLAKKTETEIDNIAVKILEGIRPPFYLVIALYISARYLNLSEPIWDILNIIFLSILVYEGVQAIQKIISFITYQALKKDNSEQQAKTTTKTLNIFIKIALWSFGLILILSNAGVNVSSLLAGLGIGGIAVALALQNILGDVFSSFSILIDKPFQVGDFIKIGDDLGVVEKIGIKTTRLKTLSGQILIVSNRELTTARVENFRQIEKRRSFFTLGLVYETPRADLERIPKLIKSIIEKEEGAEFDRCNFVSYGDFSLNFEVSFYVAADNYNEFLDIVERVNLEIFTTFKDNNLNFAYPTQLQYEKKL
ncbi:mechanosensitive ion channel family protein [Patescibacteria group bacterium]|nr:mechanosensitive ion channel family protein [Patescibacteria group bacterium]